MRLDKSRIQEALRLLAARLEVNHAEPYHLVISGGTSLIVTGMVKRTTRDVDVVGIVDGSGTIISADPMASDLERAVDEVAVSLDLPQSWLNTGPTSLIELGLPDGLAERLITQELGPFLRVSFIGRLDQIYFKLYAAADQGPGRHVDDLQALQPTEAELEAGARWSMTHDVSDDYRNVLKDMLKALGYENVSHKL